MRKVILNMAISLDGYIADLDGGFNWIKGQGNSDIDTVEQYDYELFLKNIDTVIMGALAYEDCILSGLESFSDKKIYVVTSRDLPLKSNVELIQEDINTFLSQLKEKEGRSIWVFGGALLAQSIMQDTLIDAYILGIVPVILGEGRRLFKGGETPMDLLLKKCTIRDGITILQYEKKLKL